MSFLRSSLLALPFLLSAAATAAFDPWAGDFTKSHPDDIRVMSYNVFNQFPQGTQAQYDMHARILGAIQPDIISFQEMDPGSALATKIALDAILGGDWSVHEGQGDGFNTNMVASRWLLGARRTDTVPASSFRGTTMALVNLPQDRYPANFYVMGVHFACCTGTDRDAFRQRHADAVASWMGKAQVTGGEITLPPGTPMLLVGDVNFNASANPQPRTTILTGDIQDTATFGPPVRPDWDGTDIEEALPLDPFSMRFQTFHGFSGNQPNSWLDRMYYTDSVLEISQAFVFNTESMTNGALSALGVLPGDTALASDHLPVVVDFAFRSTDTGLARLGDVFVTEFQPDPTFVPDVDGEWLELYNATGSPIDLTGWMLMDSGTNRHVIRGSEPVVIAPGQHLVLGLNGNRAANGNVPVDYVLNAGFRLANGADTIELYRGSVKIDGILYNGGGEGLRPPNRDAGAAGAARARAMGGDYSSGPTGLWGAATSAYNPADFGTPGTWNDGALVPTGDQWLLGE